MRHWPAAMLCLQVDGSRTGCGLQDSLGGPQLTGMARCAGGRELGQHEAVQAQLPRNSAQKYLGPSVVTPMLLGPLRCAFLTISVGAAVALVSRRVLAGQRVCVVASAKKVAGLGQTIEGDCQAALSTFAALHPGCIPATPPDDHILRSKHLTPCCTCLPILLSDC